MTVNVVKEVTVKEDLGVTLLEDLCENMVVDRDGDSCYDGDTYYNDLEDKDKALLLLEVVRQFKEAVGHEITWLGFKDMIADDSNFAEKSVW